jgi:hypothetical protein
VTDALLTLFFFALGLAIMVSGYRAVITPLPTQVYGIPSRVAGPRIILLRALAALRFGAWYLTDLELSPAP